jgi:hypothetical protein
MQPNETRGRRNPTKPIDILKTARSIFVEGGKAHSKRAAGRDAEGDPQALDLERAHGLSITGAIMLASLRHGLSWFALPELGKTTRKPGGIPGDAVAMARDALGMPAEKRGDPYHDLANWNDRDETTRDHVIVILSRACGMTPKVKLEGPAPAPELAPRPADSAGIGTFGRPIDPTYSQALGAGSKVEGEIGTTAARIAAHELPDALNVEDPDAVIKLDGGDLYLVLGPPPAPDVPDLLAELGGRP